MANQLRYRSGPVELRKVRVDAGTVIEAGDLVFLDTDDAKPATDHLFLVDLIGREYTGKDAEEALGRAHITVNKNTVPGEPRSPFVTSGLRLGTPAVTTRGFGVAECTRLAEGICDLLDAIGDETVETRVRELATELCHRFPVYQAPTAAVA